MERSTPVRKPHSSTADLLTWSETPPSGVHLSGSASSRSNTRPHQLSDISRVVFGGQVTEEKAESLNQRKPCSGYKLKEITGSGIFTENTEDDAAEMGSAGSNTRTGLQMYQQTLSRISHISFGEEESISPKKLISDAKCRELSGHNIFAPAPEIVARPVPSRTSDMSQAEPSPRQIRTSVKVSNPSGGKSSILSNEEPCAKTAKKIYDKKFSELSGNNIFKEDVSSPSAEKSLISAKLREISGNDIFADGKADSRDYFGGVRKPPGGESSIALI